MKNSMSRVAASCAGALVLAVVGTAHAADLPIRFVLDWKFEGQQGQFTVPLEDGTWKKMGLDVHEDRGAGSGDTVTKVGSGTYDVGYADIYAMVRFNAANPDHKLIAIMMNNDVSAVGVVTLTSSGIKKPSDLNGKRVASPPDAGKQLFPLFAKTNGIDENSIQWSNVAADMRDTLLVRGQADAVTGNVTTTIMNARAMGVPDNGVLPLIYAKYGVPLYGSAIVTTPAFAEAHPEAMKNFIRGLVHGLNVMIKDPKTALASVKKHDALLDEKIELQRAEIALEYMIIDDHVLKEGLSQVDMDRLQKTLDAAGPAFGISPIPKASDVYTAKYLPPKAEMKIEPWHPAKK